MTVKLVPKLCFVVLCLTWLGSYQVSASSNQSCTADGGGASAVSADDSMEQCLQNSCRENCEDAGYYLDGESTDTSPSCDDQQYISGYHLWTTTGECECDCYPLE
jgi:hypothetical protein